MSFPTSYIKTEGATVTRSADNASVDDLAGWFNGSEGTLILKISQPVRNAGPPRALFFKRFGVPGFFECLGFNSNSSGRGFQFAAEASGSNVISQTSPDQPGDTSIVAVTFKVGGNYIFAVNGVVIDQAQFLSNFPDVQELTVGSREDGHANTAFPHVKYIPSFKSATELQALTTPETN